MNIIKDYFNSLLPFRWFGILLMIMLTTLLIFFGTIAPLGQNEIDYFKYETLWYCGNFIFWFLVDILVGIGKRGWLFSWNK